MDVADPIIETERLILQRIDPTDAGFILRLLNTPGWLRFIGDRGIKNLEDARKYIVEGLLVAYEQYGYGFSKIVLKEKGEPIGGCGLIRRAGLSHADIGFALLPEYAGKGYAYEIAAATLVYGAVELSLPKVLGITLPENERSVNLLEKLGLRFEKMICLPGDDQELKLYSIDLKDLLTS